MQLVSTQGLVLIGPGSEWLWTAVSGLVLAATFIALYRQLRLQANASATDQLTDFEREWASERLLRVRLAVLQELRDGVDPARLTPAPAHFVFDFWERIGALARRGQIDPRLLATVNASVGEWWWTLLKPYVMRRRADLGPSFGEAFEWLSGIMASINRKFGTAGFDEIGDLASDIADLEWRIRVEEALRSAPVAAVPQSPRRRPALRKA